MKVLLLLISRRPSFAQFEEEQFWCRFFNGFAGPGEAFGHPALGYGEFWGGRAIHSPAILCNYQALLR